LKEELTVKQIILNEIENHPRGYSNILAEIAGYSSGSNLKKVLMDEKKEFDKFQGLIELIKYVQENNFVDMMIKYSTEIDLNKKTARNMLEFLATSRKFDALNSLLDKMDNFSSNKESKEWAKVYRMQYKYEMAQVEDEFNQLLKELAELHVTFPETKVYKKLLINYCFDQKKDYNMTKFLTMEIEMDINSIENEYIKSMYDIRLNEVKAYTYLRSYNNPEVARECSDKILFSNAAEVAFKGYASYMKGFSYLYTSFDNAVKYLNESIKYYTTINRKNEIEGLQEVIEFVEVFWDKFDKEKCLFVKNDLYFKVKKGISISSELIKYKDDIEKEFYLFLEGYNSKDNKKLMLSLIKYIKNNDLFSANFVKMQLLKKGYDQELIEEMVSIKCA
jgi:hypothetical protein